MGLRIRDSLKAAEISGMGARLSPEQVKMVVGYLDLADRHMEDGSAAFDKAGKAYGRATRALPALIYWWGV